MPQEWKMRHLCLCSRRRTARSVTTTGDFPAQCSWESPALVLLERLLIDPQLMKTQCGFRKGRGTVDQLWWYVRWWRATEYRTPLYLCFMDLTKAYDSVNQQAMKAIKGVWSAQITGGDRVLNWNLMLD